MSQVRALAGELWFELGTFSYLDIIPNMDVRDISQLVRNDKWMVNILSVVRTLELPDWYIGAGFVRSKVWDTLHGYTKRTLIPDIDVIYLDRNDFTNEEAGKESTKAEIRYENKLRVLMPEINWSVTNQSRMHLFHNDKSYVSSEEAIGQWVETATCVGVRLDKENNVIVAAPRGIDDLVNMILRPTSDFQKELFSKRVNNKGWLKKWPKLRIG